MAGRKRKEPRLPIKQLTILAVARFAEPLALTSVFPYLPAMIRSFGVAENDIARWAGITSAAFSFSQSLTAVPWGRASDRFGRKWTIVVGLFSTMICFLIWGLSTSLQMAIVVRSIQGATNGNVGIIRTMVAEMVPERELQPRAFSIMPLVWSIGSIFGPTLGGLLAEPAKQFPALFGNAPFFKEFPFALPNLVGSIFFLVSMITATLFLRETLEGRRHRHDWGILMGKRLTRPFKRREISRQRRRSFVDGEATAPLLPTRSRKKSAEAPSPPQAPPTMRDVFTPLTCNNLVAYTILALHSVAYDQCLPVFLHHPVQRHTPENTHLPFQFSGGFGLNTNQIGTVFTVYAVACGLIQFLLFPPLCNALGVLNCYRACAMVFPIIYFITPYAVLIEDDRLRIVGIFCIILGKSFAVICGFPSMTILLTNSAPSLRILGTLNGFATTFSAIGRAIGPAAAGAAFSWGLDVGYVISAWWMLAIIATIGAIQAFLIYENDDPAVSSASSFAEDDDESESDGQDEHLQDSAVVFESDDEDADTAGSNPQTTLVSGRE